MVGDCWGFGMELVFFSRWGYENYVVLISIRIACCSISVG
jgi:hypothetical protein